jgi:hypothetical protein
LGRKENIPNQEQVGREPETSTTCQCVKAVTTQFPTPSDIENTKVCFKRAGRPAFNLKQGTANFRNI